MLVVTVGFGTLLAVLFNQPFPGRNVARVLAISPFFVMPTVSALVWKNLMMHPIYGVFGAVARSARACSRSTGSPTSRSPRSSPSYPGSGCRSRC